MDWKRRNWLKAAGLASWPALAACGRQPSYDGSWLGASHSRGHQLRDRSLESPSRPAVHRRASVLIVGAGISGLASARHLLRQGIDDVHVLELEDQAGGNSRGHQMARMDCPLGAHYLPLPGPEAVEVIELLEEWGLRRTEWGKAVYDERHLCHSPQERLWIDGQWHEGLLPPIEALPPGEHDATRAQYQRFARRVESLSTHRAFTIPTARCLWSDTLGSLQAQTFSSWLDQEGLTAPALRWYLDYCCLDDFGAGSAHVCAWAGLHYFASRHGFHAPGEAPDSEREAVLTWPQGNAWLSRKLIDSLGGPADDRLHTAQISWRVTPHRHTVEVDTWNAARRQNERWQAEHVILATPLFVSARLLQNNGGEMSSALQALGSLMRHAPWLVANLHVAQPLDLQRGAPQSWDNVVYDPQALQTQAPGAPMGWVDATHQNLRPDPGPTVLTAYWAFGGQSEAQLQSQRARLLKDSWADWAARALSQPARVHPDLPHKVRRIDLMRYGHAMSIPVPGLRSHPGLQALAQGTERLHFAHSDLSAYSVFEEAVYWGVHAATQVLRRLQRTRLNPLA